MRARVCPQGEQKSRISVHKCNMHAHVRACWCRTSAACQRQGLGDSGGFYRGFLQSEGCAEKALGIHLRPIAAMQSLRVPVITHARTHAHTRAHTHTRSPLLMHSRGLDLHIEACAKREIVCVCRERPALNPTSPEMKPTEGDTHRRIVITALGSATSLAAGPSAP